MALLSIYHTHAQSNIGTADADSVCAHGVAAAAAIIPAAAAAAAIPASAIIPAAAAVAAPAVAEPLPQLLLREQPDAVQDLPAAVQTLPLLLTGQLLVPAHNSGSVAAHVFVFVRG